MSALALLVATMLQGPKPVVARKHEVNLWVARDVAPGPKIRLNLNSRNVPFVHIEAFPVDAIGWLSRRDNDSSKPAPIGPAVRKWDVNMAAGQKAIQPLDNYYSRQVNLPVLKPGVYLLVAKGGEKEVSGVVNVTNLAVVMKASPSQTLAWVTDFKTGQVVPGADVLSFDRDGKQNAAAKTGADGVAMMTGKVGNFEVVVRRGGDYAGLRTSATSPDGMLRAHFQTDRPIYRPGQTVSFRSVLRLTQGRGYVPVTQGEATIRLRDSRDNPLDEIKVRPTPMGTVSGSFKIPQEAITGPYTIGLDINGQTAYQTFSVAAYRKPEYKVDVASEAKRYLSGEKIRFKVKASYYFGAPVPQAKIHWVASLDGISFFSPGEDDRMFYGGDGNLYPQDTYSGDPVNGEGETVTDNEGNAVIEVKTNPDAPDSTYSISLTVEDASRRQVTASSGVPVYAAAVRVGITSNQQVTPLSGLIPLELRLIDLDGRPVGGKAHLNLIETYWNEKDETPHERIIADRDVLIPPTGKVETSLPARKEGDLRVDVSVPDRTGRVAKTSMSTWVASPFYKPEKEQPSPEIDVKLDRRVYAPGGTANAYATTNRPTRPMLVMVEGRQIFGYKVLGAGKTGRSWSFPTTLEESPNSWVTVSQWSENGLMTSTKILATPDATRKISVEATPDKKEVHPGDPMRVKVTTRDASGKPISAEVSLSVVDEAIYALSPDTTPDPYGFYWGKRGNSVSTFSSAPEEVSGGAYQRSNALAPVRQRFEDTAYWNPSVVTGPDGTGFADFEVPGNLTTWRTTARGITMDTRVGMGKSSFVATRALTLRLATPRLVAQGDEFTLIGTVNNRSDSPVSVNVSLDAKGIEVPGGPKRVDAPAHGEATVRWTLNATKTPPDGKFTLLASANGPSAELSDALQVSVPIVPRGVRETVLAGGALEGSAKPKLTLPADAMPDGAVMTVRVFAGMGPAKDLAANHVFTYGRYGSPVAGDVLMAASQYTGASGKPFTHADDVREALALLSRTQTPDGWGWWENSPSDPVITARIGRALAFARDAGIRIFDQTWQYAKNGARQQYNRSNLWEHRAQLAAAMVELDEDHAGDALREVLERGIHLSPYSQLVLAQAVSRSDPKQGEKLVEAVVKLVSDGPSTAFVPVGDGIGWTATETETTAELLTALASMDIHGDLQTRLAHHLALSGDWHSVDEDAAICRALSWYGKRHTAAGSVGESSFTFGGKDVVLTPSTIDASSTADIALPDGIPSDFSIRRSGSGEALYTVSVRYYRNNLAENASGVRVSRRYEVKNGAGIWTEVDRVIHPSEAVRCTVVVWGDDRPDAVRVTEPIPTGFEFTESESTDNGQQDVRDGSVVHYLLNAGTPVYFRYYLRAESDGKLIALPAIAEYLRRPTQRGQSAAKEMVVHP